MSYPAISTYAKDHGITGHDYEIFVVMIRAMDAEFLTWLAEKREQEKTAQPTTANGQ